MRSSLFERAGPAGRGRAIVAPVCAIALLLAAASPLRGGRLQPGRPDAPGFPVLAAEIHQLVASADAIAIVSTSSMGERSVSVRRLPGGVELFRRSDVGTSSVALRGPHLAYLDRSARTVVVDVASGRERLAWSPRDDGRATAVCLGPARLFVLVHGPEDVDHLMSMALGEPLGPDGEPHRVSLAARPNPSLRCADKAAVVTSPGSDEAVVWTSDLAEVIPLAGHEVLGLTDRYLYGLSAPSTIVRRPIAGSVGWQIIYRGSSARVSGLSIADDAETIVFVERTPTGSTDVVLVPTDGLPPIRQSLPSERDWDRPELWTVTGGFLDALGRRDGSGWVFLTNLPSREETPSVKAAGPTAPAASDPDGRDKGLRWMEGQLGAQFQTRQRRRGRLIDSYEDTKRVGWTYDAAIAAIAFVARGRTDLARQLLAGLAHLQNDDGSWEFAYDPDRALPIKGERYLGTMAWVVMSANFFEWETGDRTFAGMADEGLHFVDRFVVRDPTSALHGGVSMGPVAPQTYSTEHNVDAYSAYYWRGRLAERPDYLETASKLQAFIMRELVADGDSGGAYFKVGAREPTVYLDPQTWTTLALASHEGTDGPSLTGLDVAERRLRVTSARLGSISNIVGLRDAETAGASKVWSEGTEGMVAARLWLGQVDRARSYHQETSRMQTSSGGIPYASENADGWPAVASVAGTSWYVLNHDWPPRNPFVPDNKPWLKSYGPLEKNFPLTASSPR